MLMKTSARREIALLVPMVTAAVFGTSAAHAAVTISTGTTKNMSCSAGICAPTATPAVLNVGDLENLLASGNVAVTTTGSGVQTNDIVVKAALAWSSAAILTLEGHRSLTVDQPVSVQGLSGLTLTTHGANGTLAFGRRGNITFANLSSTLTINGAAYTLENTVQGLAAAIAHNSSGNYALASDYDARPDGTYSASPIVRFGGTLEGLGNEIENLHVADKTTAETGGLVSEIRSGGVVRDLGLSHVAVRGVQFVGGLVSSLDDGGTIIGCRVSGKLRGGHKGDIGGLAAVNFGTITNTSASVNITGEKDSSAAGLAGDNQGTISESFATGSITFVFGKHGCCAGGLTSLNTGTIVNSYATGAVDGGFAGAGDVGGLAAENGPPGTISTSYSTGVVADGNVVGGGVGDNGNESAFLDDYWNTTTSGTSTGVGEGEATGVTGLTSQQLQSGLPAGFDPMVWAENPNINNGFPYLINNPPK